MPEPVAQEVWMDIRERLVRIETLLATNQGDVTRLQDEVNALRSGYENLRNEVTRSATKLATGIAIGGFLLSVAVKYFWGT